MSDEEDIYEDLAPVETEENSDRQLVHDTAKLIEHIKSLNEDIAKLCAELLLMKKREDALKKNISELYRTSKVELERKDRTIAGLRRELDDLKFRRRDKRKGNQSPHKTAFYLAALGDEIINLQNDQPKPNDNEETNRQKSSNSEDMQNRLFRLASYDAPLTEKKSNFDSQTIAKSEECQKTNEESEDDKDVRPEFDNRNVRLSDKDSYGKNREYDRRKFDRRENDRKHSNDRRDCNRQDNDRQDDDDNKEYNRRDDCRKYDRRDSNKRIDNREYSKREDSKRETCKYDRKRRRMSSSKSSSKSPSRNYKESKINSKFDYHKNSKRRRSRSSERRQRRDSRQSSNSNRRDYDNKEHRYDSEKFSYDNKKNGYNNRNHEKNAYDNEKVYDVEKRYDCRERSEKFFKDELDDKIFIEDVKQEPMEENNKEQTEGGKIIFPEKENPKLMNIVDENTNTQSEDMDIEASFKPADIIIENMSPNTLKCLQHNLQNMLKNSQEEIEKSPKEDGELDETVFDDFGGKFNSKNENLDNQKYIEKNRKFPNAKCNSTNQILNYNNSKFEAKKSNFNNSTCDVELENIVDTSNIFKERLSRRFQHDVKVLHKEDIEKLMKKNNENIEIVRRNDMTVSKNIEPITKEIKTTQRLLNTSKPELPQPGKGRISDHLLQKFSRIFDADQTVEQKIDQKSIPIKKRVPLSYVATSEVIEPSILLQANLNSSSIAEKTIATNLQELQNEEANYGHASNLPALSSLQALLEETLSASRSSENEEVIQKDNENIQMNTTNKQQNGIEANINTKKDKKTKITQKSPVKKSKSTKTKVLKNQPAKEITQDKPKLRSSGKKISTDQIEINQTAATSAEDINEQTAPKRKRAVKNLGETFSKEISDYENSMLLKNSAEVQAITKNNNLTLNTTRSVQNVKPRVVIATSPDLAKLLMSKKIKDLFGSDSSDESPEKQIKVKRSLTASTPIDNCSSKKLKLNINPDDKNNVKNNLMLSPPESDVSQMSSISGSSSGKKRRCFVTHLSD